MRDFDAARVLRLYFERSIIRLDQSDIRGWLEQHRRHNDGRRAKPDNNHQPEAEQLQPSWPSPLCSEAI